MSTRARLARLEKLCPVPAATSKYAQYAGRPVDYIREVLKGELWSKQIEICELMHKPPYKVLVKSAHKVGKTWLAGALTNYWFDVYDPGCVITTAPSQRSVVDLLWREVRLLRGNRGGFVGPKSPELYTSPDHFAKGFSTNTGENFHGRHLLRMLFLFDEAVGVQEVFWQVARSMYKPEGLHSWICFYNPTDSSSQAHREEELSIEEGGWHVVQMNALDHPNIASEIAGEGQPFPAAVSYSQVNEWLQVWGNPIEAQEAGPTDICWPPRRKCPCCRGTGLVED